MFENEVSFRSVIQPSRKQKKRKKGKSLQNICKSIMPYKAQTKLYLFCLDNAMWDLGIHCICLMVSMCINVENKIQKNAKKLLQKYSVLIFPLITLFHTPCGCKTMPWFWKLQRHSFSKMPGKPVITYFKSKVCLFGVDIITYTVNGYITLTVLKCGGG